MTVRALNIGVSGLRVESDAIGVAGDNIANVNTPGFKRQRAIFEDVFNRGSNTGGSGARLQEIGQAFTQGSLVNTGVNTDVALNGDGFFIVSGTVNGMTGSFYSRAGQFRVDPNGAIVDPSGLNVMGRALGPDGELSTGIRPLVVPTNGIQAQATTEIDLTMNVDASAPVLPTPFDLTQPSATSTTGTSITVYDSLGAPHSLDIYMNKLAENQWEYRAVMSGDDLNPPSPGQNVEVGSGLMFFNTDGALETVSENQTISVDFLSATPGQVIDLDFGTTISDGGTGLDGSTQFSMPSGVSSQNQNGFSSGALSGINFAPDGTVLGLYTNGRSVAVGQLMVAKFRATDRLARAGNNLWVETGESGPPAVAAPGAGGRGQVTAGTVETSNVDIGEEMVSMIQHQRAFSANSKVIATADEMLSQLMQIKQ
ncbi:MAG TPA: flagellar hook protein FlgE [Polyangiaceae bacterium]|nr:flagellar hook protein FlgE [Polyangiaceae bacterium]